MTIFIIGNGSHSKVVFSILKEEYSNAIIIIDYENIEDIKDKEKYKFIIAIGDNKKRYEIANKYKLNYINAISSFSKIDKTVDLGYGNVICPGVVININTKIGNHNIINTNSSIDHDCVIKDFIHIAPHVCLCGNVKINTLSFIGANSTIVPKINIKPLTFIKANSLVKESSDYIHNYEVDIDKYKTSAIDAINSKWISNHGKYIKLVENKIKEILNVKYVILMNSGTAATHCLFLSLKYKYPNINKIYVPNNCYIAAINSALNEYDIEKLEVMNMDNNTWNVDTNEEYIKSLDANSAVLIVHNLGGIVNVPKLKRIRPDLIYVEDNCEGLFGKYEDKYSGTQSLCSSISFYANKIITSGEGGAFLTNDDELYNYISKIYSQGMSDKKFIHIMKAYNYRMTNIEAALLYEQLNDLDTILMKRQKIFDNYKSLIENSPNFHFQFQKEENDTKRGNWLFPIRLTNKIQFDELYDYLIENGVEIRPFFYPLNYHHHLKDIKDNEISTKLSDEIILLPSSSLLTYEEQEYIILLLNKNH